MSAFSPRHDSSSRNWWSLAKSTSNPSFHSEKSPSRDPTSKKSDGKKFNTIASAIGLSKSKKHPTLAIQNPPPIILTSKAQSESPYPHPIYTNRPPSKSVSSTRSRVDSIEPKTPSDPRDSGSQRQSLLTLSDPDPFAARNISALPSPADPNRLSAYSGSSIPDYPIHGKKPEGNRISYASSSSQSYSASHYMEDSGGQSWITELPRHPSRPFTDGDNLSLNDSVWDQLLDPAGMKHLTKSGSSVTLSDPNRLSQPEPTHSQSTRPLMRARGMTVGSISPRSNLLKEEKPAPPPVPSPAPSFNHQSPTSLTSPRLVVRQPSMQRMGLPSTAPPSQRLPPPPQAKEEERTPRQRRTQRDSVSSALSSLSRDTGMSNQVYIPRTKALERSLMPSSHLTEEAYSSPRHLKKAVSQQSLKTVTASTSILPAKAELPVEKGPRKQRSFHHGRKPNPPVPATLRHTSSFSNGDNSQPVELKREADVGPPPVRKRLFSGSNSRRPSTSPSIAPEEDTKSIFSISVETDRNTRKTSGQQVSSFWDNEGDTPSSPHASVADYTPMQIMSPAEMLKLEADVQSSPSSERSRARGFSITSTAASITSESDYGHPPSISAVVSPSGSSLRPLNLTSARSNSMYDHGDHDGSMKPATSSRRPSTSQGTGNYGGSYPSYSSTEFVSLPPPPRPRRTPNQTSVNRLEDMAEPPAVSLPPPPRSKSVKSTKSTTSARSTATTTPPVSTVRKGIIRKPSFLHIDDEAATPHVERSRTTPKEETPQARKITKGSSFRHEDSFLDFARDSLDTLRSDE